MTVTLVAASARRHPKVPEGKERALIWVVNERPIRTKWGRVVRVVIDVDGTVYADERDWRRAYIDTLELLSPERYPPRDFDPASEQRRSCEHCGVPLTCHTQAHNCRWRSTLPRTIRWRARVAAMFAVVLLAAPAWASDAEEIERLDVILPATLWTHVAWKILRQPDGQWPGCGAELASAASGNGNTGMYYVSLIGRKASIECADEVLDNARTRQ